MTLPPIPRSDGTLVGRWWWTVDRWLLGAVLLLALAGTVLVAAASPAVAQKIGLPPFHFVLRHGLFLLPALVVMLAVSLLDRVTLRRAALVGCALFYGLTLATLVFGDEINGATRWLDLGPVGLQPSEFLKPLFIVVTAWLFSRAGSDFPGRLIGAGALVLIVATLLLQPDLGMTLVVCAVWGTQLFLAGLPMILVCAGIVGGVGLMAVAYLAFPHVQSRIDRFVDPQSGDTYQVDRSLAAFQNGGWWGTGPGEGTVKAHLPDAHADFIFAVAGEEFGLLATLALVALYALIVGRGFLRLSQERDLFVLLAGAGLLVQIAVQALIHIGSSLHLLPAKGMTLPFVSYGGSSLLALGLGFGMVLALTRSARVRDLTRPGGPRRLAFAPAAPVPQGWTRAPGGTPSAEVRR